MSTVFTTQSPVQNKTALELTFNCHAVFSSMVFRRPLIPCILAYAAGLWLAHSIYHSWPAAAFAIGGIATALACGISWIFKDFTALYLLLILALGATVMGVRERQERVARDIIVQLQSPSSRIISGKVKALTELADTEESRLVLMDVRISSGSQTLRLPGLVNVSMEPQAMAGGNLPVPGERIVFPGRIYKPAALHNFFGYNRVEALRHDAVYAGAAPLPLQGIVRIQSGPGDAIIKMGRRLSNFRKQVSNNLQRHMWEREGRLMVAMLFNDMRGLKENEKAIFRDSQTFHLFAVSGMHVAILGFALNLLFRALRFGVRGSWVSVAVVLFVYLWIIGFVPSATRSYLMLVAFTAAYVLGREVDALTSLTFAVAAVVVFDPAAFMWFPWPGEDRQSGWRWWAGKGMQLIMATVAVSIFLFPLQIYYFGFWNILSPLANLLQAILAEFVLSAGVLTAVAGLISEGSGAVAGQSASFIMSLIYWVSKTAAEVPEAMFYFRQMPAWLMIACYVILISGYYLVHRDSPEFRLKGRARFATHGLCCFGMLMIFQFWGEWRQSAIEIWFLDVGQGDATIIRLPNGATMLVDGGRSEPDMGRLVVVPQLRGLGITRLDYIVATHDDDDHTGGLAEVIRTIGCNNLLVPASMKPKSQSTIEMLQAAAVQKCIVKEVSSGFTARAGKSLVEILSPHSEFPDGTPDNDQSIIVRVSLGHFSAMLMGDAGLAVEERLVAEGKVTPLTVLKAGHHGSKTSTGWEFLMSARPKCVLISCGTGNRFGHPAKDVLHRLTHAGCNVLRTDIQGAIRVETDGDRIQIVQASEN